MNSSGELASPRQCQCCQRKLIGQASDSYCAMRASVRHERVPQNAADLSYFESVFTGSLQGRCDGRWLHWQSTSHGGGGPWRRSWHGGWPEGRLRGCQVCGLARGATGHPRPGQASLGPAAASMGWRLALSTLVQLRLSRPTGQSRAWGGPKPQRSLSIVTRPDNTIGRA